MSQSSIEFIYMEGFKVIELCFLQLISLKNLYTVLLAISRILTWGINISGIIRPATRYSSNILQIAQFVYEVDTFLK